MKMTALTVGLALCMGAALDVHGMDIKHGVLPEEFKPETVEIRKLEETHARGGLPNFYRKLESKQPEVTIAYFGGSITAQNGYRVHSRKFFQSKYPDTKVKEVHAAIGGTGSDLGAFRCWHDVLKFKPDLVFVEFAVNDGGMPPLNIRKQMEGIVRQIWKDNAETDIIFVYTLVAGNIPEFQKGTMQRSASVMEDIADYYDIPSIHFGVEITKLVTADKMIMKAGKEGLTRVSGDELNIKADSVVNTDGKIPVNAEGKIPFAADGVHPYENTGHALYMSAIERSLPAIKAAGKAGAHALPSPMVPSCLDNVATVSFDDPRVHVTGTWRKDPKDAPVTRGFMNRSDDFFTFEPGAVITFKFKGSKASVYDLLGPECCIATVSVDGAPARDSRRFDGYCTYHRLALMGLCDNLDPNAVHTVVITMTDKEFDKRAVLFEHNRADFDKNPNKYAPKHYFGGCLFIVGEMVE